MIEVVKSVVERGLNWIWKLEILRLRKLSKKLAVGEAGIHKRLR